MKTASRILLLVFLVLLLLAAGAWYLLSNLNGIVAGVIEEQGSAATQTTVRVDGVDIRLAEAAASIGGLSVANPEGFTGNAVEVGAFAIALDAGSLTSDTVVVENVTVNGARVNLIQAGTRNNLQQLLANLPGSDAEPPPETGEPGKRVIINRVTLEDVSASVTLPGVEGTREVALPPLEVTDIGRDSGGATAGQVAQQLLRPLLEAALASAAGQAIKERAAEKIEGALGGMLRRLTDKNEDPQEPPQGD